MRSILVASDRSSGSASLVRTAARIAEASGATLLLLHSTWPVRAGALPQSESSDSLEAVRILFGITGPVEVDLRDKPLREAVLDRHIESSADLVVVGSSRQSGGSLLAPHLDVVQIAFRTSGGVLVVRESLKWPPERVLVPVGKSDLRNGTLESTVGWLIESAWQTGRPLPSGARHELRVLHLASGPRELNETSEELTRQLDEIESASIRAAGIHLTRCIQREPSSVDRALRRAEREKTDLIVLRRHEPGTGSPDPSALLWLRMLNEAPCSVLLLPRARRASA